jgi:hypothetical protein
MAKVTYMEIPEELKESVGKTLQPGDRFVFPRMITKKTLLSRKRKIDLKGRSIFSLMSEYWKTFSDEEKDEWRQAGLEIGLTNWQLFVQDQAARMAAEISGIATPKTLYQSWVGKAKLDNFFDELFLIQIHPRNYWIRQKVPGTKSQYSPVEITEDFALPLDLGINFKTELEAEDLNYEACYYADIWYSYQGVDRTERIKIDFPVFIDPATYGEGHFGLFRYGQTEKESVWTSLSDSIGSLTSYVVSYNLFFYFKGLKGSIYFDNIKAEHSGQNWVRDFNCRNLTEIFPRAFYQVPAHWFVIEKSGGAHFDSVYFNS